MVILLIKVMKYFTDLKNMLIYIEFAPQLAE